jgi:lipoprotein signal peptidase
LIGFRPTTNTGAAFSSFLGRYSFLQTIAFIVFILTLLLVFTKLDLKFLIPLIFIGAGSLGNAIDRFIYGGNVRDMLYFP